MSKILNPLAHNSLVKALIHGVVSQLCQLLIDMYFDNPFIGVSNLFFVLIFYKIV